jgi:hypothetical protein
VDWMEGTSQPPVGRNTVVLGSGATGVGDGWRKILGGTNRRAVVVARHPLSTSLAASSAAVGGVSYVLGR